MYLTVFSAIEKCRLLYFYYDGYFRIVEPHVFGVERRGRDALYGYQVAGADEFGKHIGWKCYLTEDMHRVQVLDAHFVGPRRGFDRNTRTWQKVYVEMPAEGCRPTSQPLALKA